MILSTSAKQKRMRDMQKLSVEANPLGFYVILLAGLVLLVRYSISKLTHDQRVALVTVTIMSGGAAIGILVWLQQVWLAIVLVFGLGIAVGIIARS